MSAAFRQTFMIAVVEGVANPLNPGAFAHHLFLENMTPEQIVEAKRVAVRGNKRSHLDKSTDAEIEAFARLMAAQTEIEEYDPNRAYQRGDWAAVNGNLIVYTGIAFGDETRTNVLPSGFFIYDHTDPRAAGTEGCDCETCAFMAKANIVRERSRSRLLATAGVISEFLAGEYEAGTVVFHDGTLWKATVSHLSTEEFEPLYWDRLTDEEDDRLFVRAISENHDVSLASFIFAMA